jgi:hypothetical protein
METGSNGRRNVETPLDIVENENIIKAQEEQNQLNDGLMQNTT